MKKTRLVWSAALAIGGVPVGCYSGAGAGNDASTTETETDGGLESESGEASGGVDSDAGEDPPIPEGCEPSASPIRRLSHVEYENTLHDLFGEDVVPELALTADPVVGGFSNNAEALTASDLLTRQYYEASRSVAQSLDPNALVGCSDADLGCPEQLIREFGAKVFRRPVTDEEASGFLDLYDKAGGDFDVGARIVVQAMLLSPSFLYRPEFGDGDGRLSGYETANRLSYFLWASMPDDALFAAAEAGELETADGVESQVRRMLADSKAREGMLEFHRKWLDLDRVHRVLKLPEENFDASVASSMQESAERLVWDTLFEGGGSFADLMTTNEFPLDDTMAALLGQPAPAGDWETVSLDGQERAGILSHPAFLASHAYGGYPSPVLRGVYVLESIVCSPVGSPPASADTTIPEFDPSMTNRELYEEATIGRGASCAGCHTLINPLGYAFENYDTMGRYRTTDNGRPVDASGEVLDLVSQVSMDPRFGQCVADRWITYATGGAENFGGGCVSEDLLEVLADTDMNAVEFVAALATHPVFARAQIVEED